MGKKPRHFQFFFVEAKGAMVAYLISGKIYFSFLYTNPLYHKVFRNTPGTYYGRKMPLNDPGYFFRPAASNLHHLLFFYKRLKWATSQKKPNYQAWEKFFFVKEKNWNKKWLLKPRGVFPTIRTGDEGFFTCFQALTLFSRF